MWECILDGEKNHYAMVAESLGDDDANELDNGLTAGHVFTLMGAYDVN
jgi:hypothetical protein